MFKEPIDVCTTQEAADLLGLSVTSVQKLVEGGEIAAWKTPGGHRRIPRESLLAYKASANRPARPNRIAAPRSTLLVVEDEEMQRAVFAAQFAKWDLPVDVSFCKSGYEALIEIGVQPPDILFLDIAMRGIDGYEVMDTVLHRPELRDMNIAIVSGVLPEELAARGGVPAGVAFFPKPVRYEELRGFVMACCMRKQRQMA
ncbi:MAG TPA: helix-turn-helix domain-containing protein [Telluria sp.]|nr:helix-turn-helix domain-containing protein [Telluria sp.]